MEVDAADEDASAQIGGGDSTQRVPEPHVEPQALAEPPEAEVKPTVVPKPVAKRTRSPKRTPAAEGNAKSSTTRKRTADKPTNPATDSEPTPGPTRKRTSARPVTS